MAAHPITQRLSFNEFLDFEALSETRHEFHDGLVLPIPDAADVFGATEEHSRLQVEIGHLLRSKQGCMVFGSSMCVYDPTSNQSRYPDVTLVCEPRYSDEHKRALLNPHSVFEVLSATTTNKDKGEKSDFYKGVEGLQFIVLVDSQSRWIQVSTPLEGKWWKAAVFTEPDDVIELGMCSLRLAEIYGEILPR